MTDTSKTIRLSKAAKEFNVGTSTIIDFLAKKGHQIESNPNTKISEDVYAILVKEYQSEKIAKEESKKVDIGGTKRDVLINEEPKIPIVKEIIKENETEKEDLIIKTNVSVTKKEEIFEKVEKIDSSSLKIIGQMNPEELDKALGKTKSKEPSKQKEVKTEKTKKESTSK